MQFVNAYIRSEKYCAMASVFWWLWFNQLFERLAMAVIVSLTTLLFDCKNEFLVGRWIKTCDVSTDPLKALS